MSLLRVEKLTVALPGRRVIWGRGREHLIVRDVSFAIPKGRTVSLVGESGSGKTTTGRAILKLSPVVAGRILFDGVDVVPLSSRQFFPWRKRMQMIFQDPWHSLNPRLTVGRILSEPFEIHFPGLEAAGRHARVSGLLERVGLPVSFAGRYPHELSGGQRQRIGIARALAVEPELIVCDEPVSALDMAAQAQIIALLRRLQAELGFGCLFISHDLAVVEQISDTVLVMRQGEIVEQGGVDELYTHPQHPYTRALIDAVPDIQRMPL